jgi:hypothetical protein
MGDRWPHHDVFSDPPSQELLGWKPTHPCLIEDIEQGHYFI